MKNMKAILKSLLDWIMPLIMTSILFGIGYFVGWYFLTPANPTMGVAIMALWWTQSEYYDNHIKQR